MKTIYFVLIIIVLSSISCVKQLDLSPENSITFANGIKTERDIESLIHAVDQTVRLNLYAPNDFVTVFRFYSNTPNESNINSEGFKRNYDIIRRSSLPKGHWGQYYKIIHQANIPLRYLDQTDMTASRKDYYRGRAYFYKAFAYLWLIRIWGDVILIKDDVILEPVAKTPWPEVADYAIDLAEKAVALLPEYREIRDAQGAPPTNKFSPSKGAANALLANLTAWKAGAKYLAQPQNANYDEGSLWKKSAEACTKIIDFGQYSLATNPEAVCESVLVGNSNESIYEIEIGQYWDEITSNMRGTYFGHIYTSQPQYNIPINFQISADRNDYIMLVDSVKRLFSANDLRVKSWFYKFDSLSNVPSLKGQAFSNKYRRVKHYTSGPDLGKTQGYLNNYIFWRLADIYLLRAECRARLGETEGAIADLNIVRARSKADLYENTEGNLRYAIYEEKVKKELLYEQHSFWFDVIRNGYVHIEPTLKELSYAKLSNQDLRDGALFLGVDLVNNSENNPLLRQNVYWNKRFGQ